MHNQNPKIMVLDTTDVVKKVRHFYSSKHISEFQKC